MTLAELTRAAADEGLLQMGAFHLAQLPARTQANAPAPTLDSGTLVLLGTGADFWPVFTGSPEFRDAVTDPVNSWSLRVVGALADQFQAVPHFPFGGPPYAPFITWALASGRAFSSPTGMLVHNTVGMMISYRGALWFPTELELPAERPESPCNSCTDQPCTQACPVAALSADKPYDVSACHDWLDTAPGQDCMSTGCAARRACPVSQSLGRDPAQSALHMKAFHPT